MTTRTPSVRAAGEPDGAAVAQLMSQLGYDVPTDELTARLLRIVAHADQQLFVAEVEGRVAGWVHIMIAEYFESGRFAEVAGLVVDRNLRRTGIGQALMSTAEAWAGAHGCTVVRLRSTVTRTPAHRFYERLGYTIIKTQHSFAKAIDGSGPDGLKQYVPKVERS